MRDASLALLDAPLAAAAGWVGHVARRTGTDAATALDVLRAGLHALRDRLPPADAVRFAQRLPLVVRGLWFEDWHPAETPLRDTTLADWLVTLEGHLLAADADRVPAEVAAGAVFSALKSHLGPDDCREVERLLPGEIAARLRAA